MTIRQVMQITFDIGFDDEKEDGAPPIVEMNVVPIPGLPEHLAMRVAGHVLADAAEQYQHILATGGYEVRHVSLEDDREEAARD
jgi:hypothetical protein